MSTDKENQKHLKYNRRRIPEHPKDNRKKERTKKHKKQANSIGNTSRTTDEEQDQKQSQDNRRNVPGTQKDKSQKQKTKNKILKKKREKRRTTPGTPTEQQTKTIRYTIGILPNITKTSRTTDKQH